MSAGDFINSRYESNSGRIYGIKVQPETLAFAFGGVSNGAPAGAVTEEVSARVGGGNKAYGMKARSVTLRSPSGTGTLPAGYKPDQLLRVPILVPDLWESLPPRGGTATYLGTEMEIVGKSPQREK